MNDAGIALIKAHEGCRLTAYLCPAGIPTIGYGHTGPDVHVGMTITQEQADDLLKRDLARTEFGVMSALRGMTPTPNELAAMVSLAFNIGVHAFEQSTVAKCFAAADIVGAAAAFARWNKATVNGQLVTLPGLVKRRADEAALFLKDTV